MSVHALSPIRKRALAGLAAAGLVSTTLVGTAVAAPNRDACADRDNNSYRKLLECVTVQGVRAHQAALQAVADANGGTRASGTPGYAASVDYVESTLLAAGWTVERDPFPFVYVPPATLRQTAPVQATYPTGTFTGTGYGEVTASVVPIDINLVFPRANTSGCEVSDFAGFPVGSIALVQRGTCNFSVKAINAEAAGATAVIIFNQGNDPTREGLITGTLGGTSVVDIPVVGASFADGASLSQPGSSAYVDVDPPQNIEVDNLIAELPGVNDSNVVMAGAHLDSVQAGPGIQDDGSGSAALLEVAQRLGDHVPQNTLRFAWWGAEEAGLIGSTDYVTTRTPEQLDEIALYLNFDMIGSPNYIFMVYDADQSTFPAPSGVPIPPGSDAIEATFESFYTLRGEPYDDTQFSGRSDYQAFINNGIPSSGLFTGAEVPKTAQQAAIWGGTAGAQFDPCYHLACDTYANINLHALDVNSDAVAFAVLTYAYSTESVNGVAGVPVAGKFTVPAPAGPEGTFASAGGGLSPDHDHALAAS